MKRIVLAVLLAAAPAFADHRDRSDDGAQPDWSGSWDDGAQYDWAQSDGSEGDWDSWDDSAAYGEERGPTFDDFRTDSELSWSGEWIDTPQYGTVWRPTHVDDDWQPYLYGRWVWTRAGWAWASEEPFGWAVYHYGRWAWAPALGWMWVPGRVWAPAWVAWRWSDGYAAWCPLGPRSVVVERPSLWVVVQTRDFLEPVRRHVVPRRQRHTLPLPAQPGPHAGPAVTVVERAIGRSLRPLPIGVAGTPSSARAGSNGIDFYRPRAGPVATTPRAVAPAPQGPRTVAPAPQGPRTVAPAPQQGPRTVAPAPQGPRAVTPGQPERPAAQTPHARFYLPPGVTPPPAPGASNAVPQRTSQSAPQGPRAAPPRAQPDASHGQPPSAPAQPAAPHAGTPHAGTPHASAPIQSNAEQPQAKER